MNCFSLDDLVNQLLLEILVKLPIKSVHRCKSVSKRWNSLISDSYFSREYTRRRPKYSPSQCTSLLDYQIHDEDLFKHHCLSINFVPTSQLPRILGSCNGLALCGEKFYLPCPSYICNPLTRQWLEIPPPPLLVYYATGFVCDSKDQDFSSKTKYNVVCIPVLCELKNRIQVLIFSFDTMEWSEIEVRCPREIYTKNICRRGAVCCNGVLYWLLYSQGIIAYDLYNSIDQFNIINFPQGMDVNKDMDGHTWTVESIGVCQDRLRLCQAVHYFCRQTCLPSLFFLKVWQLKTEKIEWTLEYNICLRDLVVDGGHGVRSFVPMRLKAIDAVDRDVVYVLANPDNRLYSCNLRSKTAEPTCLFKIPPHNFQRLSLFVLPWWPTPLPSAQPKSPL